MVSLATLFTTIVFSCLLLIFVALIRRWMMGTSKLCIYVPIICMGIIAVRFVLPFEWNFTHTIPLGGSYASLSKTLCRVVIDNAVMKLTLWDVLVGVFILGAIIRFGFLLIRQAQYSRYIDAIPAVSYTPCRTVFGAPINVPCIVDDNAKIAFTCGLLKPRIVFPNFELSEEERNFIISHEVAHIEYGDLWIKYFVQIICSLYWWIFPLAILLRVSMDKVLENRVDDTVMRTLDRRGMLAYITCLQKMMALNTPKGRRFFFAAHFASERIASLKKRFDLMNEEKQSRPLSNILVFIVLVLTIGTSFVVFEPYGLPESVELESALFNPTECYLVTRDDGEYDLYINGQWVAEIDDSSTLEGIVIYNDLEEVPK